MLSQTVKCLWLPVIYTERPVFARELVSQTAFVGQTVQFIVSVNASPPASLTWLVNGFPLYGLLYRIFSVNI